MIPDGGNGLVCVVEPRERMLLPAFVDSRDSVKDVLRAAGLYGGYHRTQGCRIEINRNELVYGFLNDPRQAEWWLSLDNDMVFPTEIGIVLSSRRLPVVGGLYFQSAHPYDPVAYTLGEKRPNRWGVPTQYYNPLRDQVYDFLEINGVPYIPYPMTMQKPLGDPLLRCDGCGTGALMVHRSVFERLQPPWFTFNGDEGEDLLFCQRVRTELELPVHVDMSVLCGHIATETKTQADFRQKFLERGFFLTGYDHAKAVEWLAEFMDLELINADELLRNYHPEQMGKLWHEEAMAGQADKVLEFYEDPRVGRLYITELLNWNRTPAFRSLCKHLLTIRNGRVLEIGGGIGSAAMQLALQRNDVTMVEPNQLLRSFTAYRWNKLQARLAGGSVYGHLQLRKAMPRSFMYDTVVAIDVFEHVHPSVLPELLIEIGKMVPEGGWMYHHNNWGQQDLFPFHYDNSENWNTWLRAAGFYPANPPFWSLKIR